MEDLGLCCISSFCLKLLVAWQIFPWRTQGLCLGGICGPLHRYFCCCWVTTPNKVPVMGEIWIILYPLLKVLVFSLVQIICVTHVAEHKSIYDEDLLGLDMQFSLDPQGQFKLPSAPSTPSPQPSRGKDSNKVFKFGNVTIPLAPQDSEQQLSNKAKEVVAEIEDLSFMLSSVLMFPLKSRWRNNWQYPVLKTFVRKETCINDYCPCLVILPLKLMYYNLKICRVHLHVCSVSVTLVYP